MMRLAPVIAALLLSACISVETHEAPPAAVQPAPSSATGKSVSAPILNTQGQPIGEATFREGPWTTVIRLEFSAGALPAGWHGVHLHQAGDCADFVAGFVASGAHVGKGHMNAQHGLLNPGGPEAGDLPNIFAPASGAFGAELSSSHVTLAAVAQGHRAPLLGEKGSALIIHANADDHTSQPIGNAGGRIACAAIKP